MVVIPSLLEVELTHSELLIDVWRSDSLSVLVVEDGNSLRVLRSVSSNLHGAPFRRCSGRSSGGRCEPPTPVLDGPAVVGIDQRLNERSLLLLVSHILVLVVVFQVEC